MEGNEERLEDRRNQVGEQEPCASLVRNIEESSGILSGARCSILVILHHIVGGARQKPEANWAIVGADCYIRGIYRIFIE
jgi:hypothetical protein